MQALHTHEANLAAIRNFPQHAQRDRGVFLIPMEAHERSPAVIRNVDQISAVRSG
jgi:hypothetical protein